MSEFSYVFVEPAGHKASKSASCGIVAVHWDRYQPTLSYDCTSRWGSCAKAGECTVNKSVFFCWSIGPGA